jgi:hypothetical protein
MPMAASCTVLHSTRVMPSNGNATASLNPKFYTLNQQGSGAATLKPSPYTPTHKAAKVKHTEGTLSPTTLVLLLQSVAPCA